VEGWHLVVGMFATASRPTPVALSSGVQWPESGTRHSPPSIVEVKNAWSYSSNPPYVFMTLYLILYSTVVIICTVCFNVK
jgi:hypothetical protein